MILVPYSHTRGADNLENPNYADLVISINILLQTRVFILERLTVITPNGKKMIQSESKGSALPRTCLFALDLKV